MKSHVDPSRPVPCRCIQVMDATLAEARHARGRLLGHTKHTVERVSLQDRERSIRKEASAGENFDQSWPTRVVRMLCIG